MDFRFTKEEEEFRKELRVFLQEQLPRGLGSFVDLRGNERWEWERKMRRKLAEKGWLAMSWPKEYGGQGASYTKQLVYAEEMVYHDAPGRDTFGVGMLGPSLIIYGTEEQKKRHLAGIARGEVVWCQGYSEPGSGSDLASLQTRAVLDGDDYVINGQKIWTSGGHRADWMFLLARTDPQAPKHKGISFFLLDLKTPGITIRPLINMANDHEFNEVFFEDVRVPKGNVVGEVNQGWYVGVNLLNFERSGIEFSAEALSLWESLVRYTKEAYYNGRPIFQDPLVQNRLAEMAIEIDVSRLLAYRVAWLQGQGLVPDAQASMSKLFGSEVWQRLALMGMQILNLHGQLIDGSPWAPLKGKVERFYIYAVPSTIYSGTSEIQRNIIALRGLGLPR